MKLSDLLWRRPREGFPETLRNVWLGVFEISEMWVDDPGCYLDE
jgi:hypothetical protein